jgi:hypothetical protein
VAPRNRHALSGRPTQRSRPLVEDLAARGQRRVTLIVPSGCAESLVLLARELRARQRVATAGLTQRWRRLSPSAELLVDVKTGARCTIRDTGGLGLKRYLWTASVFGEHQLAEGRTGGLAEARAQAERAVAHYIASRPERLCLL